jgi:hypothetical protein
MSKEGLNIVPREIIFVGGNRRTRFSEIRSSMKCAWQKDVNEQEKPVYADSLEDFASRVSEGGGKEIIIGGENRRLNSSKIRFSIACAWRQKDGVVLFREDYIENILSQKNRRVYNNHRLLLTIDDRKNWLQEKLAPDVKIVGPADKPDGMDPDKYKKMLSQAKGKGISPLGKQMYTSPPEKELPEVLTEILNDKPELAKKEEIIKVDSFESFVRLAEENKIDAKKVKIEPYEQECKAGLKEIPITYIEYGTEISTRTSDQKEIIFFQPNLIVPKYKLSAEKEGLIENQLFDAGKYYFAKVKKRLEPEAIPTPPLKFSTEKKQTKYEKIISEESRIYAEKEVQKKIPKPTPLEYFIPIVKDVGGDKINIDGVIKMTKNCTAQFLNTYIWQARNIKILFSEVHKEIAKGNLKYSDNLRLVVTTEDRIRELQEKLPVEVKIVGPADRKNNQRYMEMLLDAKDNDIGPFIEQVIEPFVKKEKINYKKIVNFERFARLALGNKVEEITVEPYYQEKMQSKDADLEERGFGMMIQTVLPNGKQIRHNGLILMVNKNEFRKGGKNLIGQELFLNIDYNSSEIERGLGIPTRVLVEDWEETRREATEYAKENNIAPVAFPELAKFLNDKDNNSFAAKS